MAENKTSGNSDFFENEYMPKMNLIGKITGALGVILAFLPALTLAVVYGILPKPAALLSAFIAGASSFGVLWFVEPISYFSVLGPIGTYMAFLSGNISNMRVPCASMAQTAAEVEPGTEQGSVIATLGMAMSIVINISVLTIGVILGSSILAMLPESITSALNYLLPALFGALLVQFGIKMKNHTIGILIFAVLINIGLNAGIFNWLPGASNYLGILTSVFLSIAVAVVTYKKKGKASAK
ncbi:MAG: hypothetical protein LUG24_05375 [Clostridiales bacterium]|nr:hypothetical protein [Clostridiales bacterium]